MEEGKGWSQLFSWSEKYKSNKTNGSLVLKASLSTKIAQKQIESFSADINGELFAPNLYVCCMLPVYFRSGSWLARIFPSLEWKVENHQGMVYLTFDDGPHPIYTPWVLDQLDAFGCQATFFCIGANIEKFPDIYQDILKRGHAVGNHTFHHLNGYKFNTADYLKDVSKCGNLVPGNLFRPPYGRLTRSQIKRLKGDYRIVMWSILSGDYDAKLDRSLSLNVMKKHMAPGSIVVFHDSEKASANLQFLLPDLLHFMQEKGLKSTAL
jgi:peptidoglycan/xylan/chitin deacetylase (PgdA/CDA1 family)